jgi:hypothetical protein
METERSTLSLILVPAIVSNVVTLMRLGLELAGLPKGTSPGQPTWWVSVSLLIPLAGLYFGYLLKGEARPFRRLAGALLAYAYSVRIPTAIIYFLSGALGWDTHYSVYGPQGSAGSYLTGGLLPQLIFWPIVTVVGGMILGVPLILALRGRTTAGPASA